jgi:hypothetical protein
MPVLYCDAIIGASARAMPRPVETSGAKPAMNAHGSRSEPEAAFAVCVTAMGWRRLNGRVQDRYIVAVRIDPMPQDSLDLTCP